MTPSIESLRSVRMCRKTVSIDSFSTFIFGHKITLFTLNILIFQLFFVIFVLSNKSPYNETFINQQFNQSG
jgi:hypothetical protein